MNKLLRGLLAAALAVCLLGFAACRMVETDDEAVKKLVVATVNGENITNEDWRAVYASYYNYLVQYYGVDPSTEEGQAQLESYKESALDAVIANTVWKQAAKAAGFFTFTDAQRAAAKVVVQADIEKAIQALVKTLEEAVEGQNYEGTDFYAMAKEQYERDMANNGETVDTRTQDKLEADAVENYKKDQVKNVKPLEADIVAKYGELKKAQTETAKIAEEYVSAYNNGDIMVVNPEGYMLVQHILISFSESEKSAISTLSSAVSTLESAVEDLQTQIDDTDDEAEKATLQASLATKQEELSAKKQEKDNAIAAAAANIQEESNAVLASVQGADEAKFIEVMLAKTEDTGMNTEETAKKGYLVGEDDGMVTSFHDAAVALTADGQISGLVASDYGYHIIRRIKAITAGTAALEDVRAAITESLTTSQQSDAWDKKLQELVKAAKIKKNLKNLIYNG